MTALPRAKLEALIDRFALIEARMADPADPTAFIAAAREHAELAGLIERIRIYLRVDDDLATLRTLIDDPTTDPDTRALFDEERRGLEPWFDEMTREIQLELLPKDAADQRSVILEIRAGTGGNEAALFAGDLLRMYERYATIHGWRLEIMSESEGTMGGYKEVIAEVNGVGVYGRLKFESGVHRVQRVPTTETQGRIHTSAATVAVLPEAEEVDVAINEADLRIDVFRASGAGGQHVNKTESAVRITHLPSGIVVATQDQRSQHQNKAQAMKLLRARLFDAERERLAQARAADRRAQVGSGDRSERIRTYNFPQGRVTDHRINLTLYDLPSVMAGFLDTLTSALIADHQATLLAQDQAG